MQNTIKRIADDYTAQLIEYRRYLHQNPELSFQETHTAAWVREKLVAWGMTISESVRGNSVVGILDSGTEGPTIAFRADMDALPIQEETGLPFRSTRNGVMHACGHDLHTATMLCLADALTHHKELLRGRVKFIFQQGEEVPPGGALLLCEDGVMDDVDMIFGFHNSPSEQVGQVAITSGPRTAAAAAYEIKLTGRGGHGGYPHKAINPINTAAELVSMLNQIISQQIDAQDTAVLTVSYFLAGPAKSSNVIPETAVMGGNIRTFKNEMIDDLLEKIRVTAEGLCAINGCKCDMSFSKGYPAVINTPAEAQLVEKAISLMGYELCPKRGVMGAEDFSQYLLRKPGAFMKVGVCDPERAETAVPGHNSRYCPDERGMKVALEVLLATYVTAVGLN